MKAAVRALLELGSPKFDVIALVEALEREGVPFDQLEFDSRVELALRERQGAPSEASECTPHAAPSPELVQSLAITRTERGALAAQLTLNLGLLSSRSPLPSYFLRFFEQVATRSTALEVLSLLDRSLLRDRVRAFRPERHLPEFESTPANLLAIAERASPACVHWLFSRVFPEFSVDVVRSAGARRFRAATSSVGSARLSSAVLGGRATRTVAALAVTLSIEEASDGAGVPWRVEAQRRLNEVVLPSLARAPLHLRVVLVCPPDARAARVGDAEVHFDALESARAPYRVEIFAGEIPVHESTSV